MRDEAMAMPVRESGAGSASITSCESRSRENGAAARIAAAIVIPPEAPKTSASRVYGPPRAGIWSGSANRTVAPRWAETKLSTIAKAAMRTTAKSRRRIRRRPAPAASADSAAASTMTL